MTKEFLSFIKSYSRLCPDLSSEEIEFLRSCVTIKTYAKKEFFLESGHIQKDMGFVYQGLLRRYYVNHNDKKITTSFTSENEYATDYPAFIRQVPSKYFIECLEPTTILKIPFFKIQEGYHKFKNHQIYGRKIAEHVLTSEIDRVESFLFENPKERYLNFIKKNKQLINRISLSHLSSLLGIERQSLSRIRKRIVKK